MTNLSNYTLVGTHTFENNNTVKVYSKETKNGLRYYYLGDQRLFPISVKKLNLTNNINSKKIMKVEILAAKGSATATLENGITITNNENETLEDFQARVTSQVDADFMETAEITVVTFKEYRKGKATKKLLAAYPESKGVERLLIEEVLESRKVELPTDEVEETTDDEVKAGEVSTSSNGTTVFSAEPTEEEIAAEKAEKEAAEQAEKEAAEQKAAKEAAEAKILAEIEEQQKVVNVAKETNTADEKAYLEAKKAYEKARELMRQSKQKVKEETKKLRQIKGTASKTVRTNKPLPTEADLKAELDAARVNVGKNVTFVPFKQTEPITCKIKAVGADRRVMLGYYRAYDENNKLYHIRISRVKADDITEVETTETTEA